VRSDDTRQSGWRYRGPNCSTTTRIAAASRPHPPYRSSYLGACDLSLNELTGIYATFADQGICVRQHIVVQVLDDKDHVLYQYQGEATASLRAVARR